MVCIYCGRNTKVSNSRSRAKNPSVWRRRYCLACQATISTLELPDYSVSLVVRGRSGKLYPFNRDKLFLSLHRSLEHRKDALNSASELTATVIGRLLRTKTAPDGLIPMKSIADTAYTILRRFDPPAAHSYKAFHASLLKD